MPTAAEMAERRYDTVPARLGAGEDAGFGWLADNEDADLLNLDSTELESLLARVRDESAVPAVLELVDTLADACCVDKAPDTFAAATEVIGKTIEAAVLRKNFRHAHALLRDLRARFEPALVDPACAALASGEPMAKLVGILEDEQIQPGTVRIAGKPSSPERNNLASALAWHAHGEAGYRIGLVTDTCFWGIGSYRGTHEYSEGVFGFGTRKPGFATDPRALMAGITTRSRSRHDT